MTPDEQAAVVAVTGANGYVGSCIVRALERHGYQVRRLQRSGHVNGEPEPSSVGPFMLGQPVDPQVFAGADALVHCAYDFGAATWPEIEQTNVDGSLALFQTAHDAGVRTLIFISSMSAFEGCRSMYGRAKLMVEQRGHALNVIAVRPGLVYGEQSGGMVGALSKLLSLPLVTPLVGSGNQVLYLVHEHDLGAMIAHLCADAPLANGKPIIAADPHPMSFREILIELARRQGRRPRFLPVPWQLEWGALKTAEALGLRLRLRSDSLISLLHQDPTPDFAESAGFVFRAFAQAGA